MAAVEVTKRLPLGADAAWAFLMSPVIQERWLGAEGSIPPKAGSSVVVSWETAIWRTGIVDEIADDHLVLTLKPPPSWQARHGRATRVSIDVVADPSDGAALVTVQEEGFEALDGASDPEAAAAEASRRWQKALDDLSAATSAARKRSQDVRQAVLVIHGIGEQTPGETVRSLVQAAAEPAERAFVRSKPDRISKTFELRRWQIRGSHTRPTTDFFEVYWAHRIRDTTMSQVLAWLRRLLLRRPRDISAALRPIWWTAWLAVGLAAWFVISFLPGVDIGARWLSFVGSVALGVVSAFLIDHLGDAARYLWPHPANVAVRDSIRSSGVDLLEAVHATGRYHRIVIVGHSLGSVIAHDIISHYWIATHQRHRNPVSVTNHKAARLAQLIVGGDRPGDDDPGSPWSVWGEMRRNTQPWRITDLITLGSPLTHATVLLAKSPEDLEGMFDRKELAACPPRPPDDFWYDAGYIDELGRRRTFRYLAHNAPFAVTRWTNFYFPVRFGFFGDVVGGPIANVFGAWVRDQPITWRSDRWRGHTPSAHSLYWRLPPTNKPEAWEHIDALRSALDLDRKQELGALAEEMPREAWL